MSLVVMATTTYYNHGIVGIGTVVGLSATTATLVYCGLRSACINYYSLEVRSCKTGYGFSMTHDQLHKEGGQKGELKQ